MAKLTVCCAFGALLLSAAADAHPFNLRFETRGDCEHAQAIVNHFDRDNVAHQ